MSRLNRMGGSCHIIKVNTNAGVPEYVSPIVVRHGDEIESLPAVTRDGYAFKQWTDEDSGAVVSGDTVITNDIAIVAEWVLSDAQFLKYSGRAAQGVAASNTAPVDCVMTYSLTSAYASHSSGSSRLVLKRDGTETVIFAAGRGGSAAGTFELLKDDVVSFICSDGKGSGYSTYYFNATISE